MATPEIFGKAQDEVMLGGNYWCLGTGRLGEVLGEIEGIGTGAWPLMTGFSGCKFTPAWANSLGQLASGLRGVETCLGLLAWCRVIVIL